MFASCASPLAQKTFLPVGAIFSQLQEGSAPSGTKVVPREKFCLFCFGYLAHLYESASTTASLELGYMVTLKEQLCTALCWSTNQKPDTKQLGTITTSLERTEARTKALLRNAIAAPAARTSEATSHQVESGLSHPTVQG